MIALDEKMKQIDNICIIIHLFESRINMFACVVSLFHKTIFWI